MEIDIMSHDFLEFCSIVFADLTFEKAGVEFLTKGIIKEIIFDILFIIFSSCTNNWGKLNIKSFFRIDDGCFCWRFALEEKILSESDSWSNCGDLKLCL